MPFADAEALALHRVMAAGDDHLDWKRTHLSETHTLANTPKLVREALALLQRDAAGGEKWARSEPWTPSPHRRQP